MDLFELETVLDGGAEAGAAEDTEAAPGAVAAPDTTAELVEAPEAAPAWAPTQDDWSALNQRLDQLSQAVAPPAAAPQEPQLADYFQQDTDGSLLIDPVNLQRFINDQNARAIKDALNPYLPVLSQVIEDRGEGFVQKELESLGVPEPYRGLARDVAEGLVRSEGTATHNNPSLALQTAAQRVDELRKAERSAAVEEYKQTLANIGKAPNDGSAAGAAQLGEPTPSGPNGYKTASEQWLARRGVII